MQQVRTVTNLLYQDSTPLIIQKQNWWSFYLKVTSILFGQAEMSYKSMIYLTLTGRNDWFSALSLQRKNLSQSYFLSLRRIRFILSEAIQMPSCSHSSYAVHGHSPAAPLEPSTGIDIQLCGCISKYPVGDPLTMALFRT